MIYTDPTETRQGSRLPAAIVEVACPLTGLESVTGADLFIDPCDDAIGYDITRPPGSIRFAGRVKHGMLVQRKSGMDLLGSLADLRTILARMYSTGAMSWLLTVGRFWPSASGHVVCSDGAHSPRQTEWAWSSYTGMLDAWQIRGGYVRSCDYDADAAEWLLSWDRKIKAFDTTREETIVLRPTHIKGVIMHPKPWVATLESFPGLGPEKADAIAEHCENLAYALMWMSGPELGVAGIGKATKEKWRRFMGLEDDDILLVGAGGSENGRTDELGDVSIGQPGILTLASGE